MALDDLLTLAAGLPAHTHWVDAGRLHAIVPTSSWAAAMGVFGGKAHTVVHSDYQQVLEAEKAARAAGARRSTRTDSAAKKPRAA